MLSISALAAFAGSAQADAEKLRVQLGWIANVQYADNYLAIEHGLFEKQGLDVTVTPGGPNAPNSLVAVAAGEADIGYTSWLPFLDAVAKGNDFVLVGVQMQSSPLGVLSMPSAPILEAKDLQGKKLLIQGPNEITSIQTTLALAGLPKDDWTSVPGGFSPEPLLAGDGQGYTAFATNQRITFELMGMEIDKDFHFKTFDEMGMPSYAGLIFTSRKYLEENRDAVVGYVAALQGAWEINEADTAAGATLMVEKYGADFGLNPDQQTRQNAVQVGIWRPANAPADFKLYSMDAAKIKGPMVDQAKAAERVVPENVDALFDAAVATEAAARLAK